MAADVMVVVSILLFAFAAGTLPWMMHAWRTPLAATRFPAPDGTHPLTKPRALNVVLPPRRLWQGYGTWRQLRTIDPPNELLQTLHRVGCSAIPTMRTADAGRNSARDPAPDQTGVFAFGANPPCRLVARPASLLR